MCGSIDYTSIGDFFFKTSMLAEERQNGTAITHNSTGLGTISLHYVREFTNDSFSLLGFHTQEGFHATFDSVTNNRNTDMLSYSQTVPSDAVGGAAIWQHHAKRWNVTGGSRCRPRGRHEHGPPGADAACELAAARSCSMACTDRRTIRYGAAKFFAGVRESFAGTAAAS